ncbi:hypothetical protein M9H77_30470 [Catharanthus roseus]|uniref:Uncharacterized protein n=1 Tax=Catharanthus roseus TaxID=4058 RepID=A0ACB9ZZM0_CATRO|nr:hypothetical protein M9H77_30470 [Catharanthus roseus]
MGVDVNINNLLLVSRFLDVVLTGLGQLSTPYALEKEGGYQHSFLEKNPKSRDYKDIGQHASMVQKEDSYLQYLYTLKFLCPFGGVLMSLLIFVTVPCTALFGGFKTNHEIPAMKIQNIPAISGLYIFSYAGHIVSLIYMQQLKDPSMFTKHSLILDLL